MASLQDQLLKAGVVDTQKAKKLNKEKRKQAKQQKGQAVVDETKQAAKQALAEKDARSREINRQKQLEADKKAIEAQIIQLINTNRVPRKHGEIAYQFTDTKTIKRLYVSQQLQDQLSKGLLAIAKIGDNYELVPAGIADKICQRDAAFIVSHHQKSAETIAEDDPYADFQIPDDLMW